ncbi:MAG: nickel-dependent hydrogenase large subunit [Parcubacteria group bacterium]|nr:nickel-dependent hydrogenase large subunit [Parcubacteria group bacterium]
MIEIIDCIEEARKLLKNVLKSDLKNITTDYKVKEGYGVGAIEAPRGTLYHAYGINKKGRITKLNIITPTAQLISNMEKDLEQYLPNVVDLSEKVRTRKIKMMIRAYDPCITCSVH